MFCQSRKGIDKQGRALTPSKKSKHFRFLSQEKYEKLEFQPFFEPLNKLLKLKLLSFSKIKKALLTKNENKFYEQAKD